MPVLPSPGDQFGRYRIERQLGFGGMGVVYAATDLELGRQVALKVVSAALGEQEFLTRFRREAEVLARLNSPHVIAIYDVGEHEGAPYIVTQLIGGGDLGDLIKARGPMPPQLAALVCAEVAEALSDAHRAGVVHRDVKPSNVLLRNPDDTRDPMAYLCDFGIAHTETDGFTRSGTVSGTWSYLSPECGRGEPGTPAADLYALGCLLWAALTGRPPYSGTDVEIAVAHQTAPIPQLAGDDDFSRAVNQVLLRAMAKDPGQRYSSADQMRDDLAALRAVPAPDGPLVPAGATAAGPPPTTDRSVPGLTTPPPTTSRRTAPGVPAAFGTAPAGRSRKGLAIGAAVVALVLVVGGGAALALTTPWSNDSPSDDPTTTAGRPIVGDTDGDGFGDIVTYPSKIDDFDNSSVYQITTWKSDGETLTPSSPEEVKGTKNLLLTFLTGDFDGDGKGDLLRVKYDSAAKDGKAADKTITMTTTGALSSTLQIPRAQVHGYVEQTGADIDGDGRTDVVWLDTQVDPKNTNRYIGRTEVWGFRNTGSGFAPAAKLGSFPSRTMERFAVGDVNGDGKADVVVLNRAKGRQWSTGSQAQATYTTGHADVDTYLGTGTGLEKPTTSEIVHKTIDSFLLGDVDGDGDDELIVTITTLANQAVRVGDWTDGRFSNPKVRAAFAEPDTFADILHPIGLSDLNGDGKVDVFTFTKLKGSDPYRVQVALSTGKGFTGEQTWATWTGGPEELHRYSLTGADLK